MPNLLIDESIAQIEDALLREISFALRAGLPAAATPAALRIRPSLEEGSPTFTDLDLVYVTSLERRFYWWQASTAADNGTTVLAPADAGTTGRWLLVTSTLSFDGVPLAEIETGLLQHVVLYNGDFSFEDLKEKIYGLAPCVAIHFDGEVHKAISQVPGALYDYRVRFEVWSVARDYRDRFEAALGSPLAAELADGDVGAMRIHGKVKKFLAGSDLGLGGTSETNMSGISHTEILGGRLDYSDLKERVFVMALEIEVRGSLANPDADSERGAVTRIDAQRMQSSLAPGEVLDLETCVTGGLGVPVGLGFAKTVAAGTATIGGVDVVVSAAAKTFTASTNTYRDLAPDGTWTFVEVADGQEIPDPAAGSLRVGMTVTDAAGVIWDAYVASTYIPSETPDQIDL